MTNKERVLMVLNHKEPDNVPYHIQFTQQAHQKMAEYFGDPNFEKKLNNALAIMSIRRKVGYKEVEQDIWQDEFGVRYNCSVEKDVGVICNQLISLETIDAFELPDPENPARYEGVQELIDSNRGQFVVVNHGFSLFERAWALAGMENILMAMVANPRFVHDLLDQLLAYNLKLIEGYCSYDINAMMFGDDWGQQTGLIMGPKLWREFIKPRVRQMYQRVKAKGKYVMIHSCGNIEDIFPDLNECGLDVFNPLQPEVMDVFAIKKTFGKDLVFYGGISVQQTLPYGTRVEVKDTVNRLVNEIGAGGGYIAAPSHSIPVDAKAENIAVMIETLDKQ